MAMEAIERCIVAFDELFEFVSAVTVWLASLAYDQQ
jgi:hypothetical protein